MKGIEIVSDATCLACGCLCDDIRLSVAENRIVRAERACPIGERWFLADSLDVPACRIDGCEAAMGDAYTRAAEVLRGKESLLVFGLAGATSEVQRLAVALADRLGATIDGGSPTTAALNAAIQSVGMVTASLGEVRHRADLVIFWGVDPETTHPRHFERYSLTCTGEFIPLGRADRTCVVIDDLRTATAALADVFLQIKSGSDAAALAALRSLAADDVAIDASHVAEKTGVEFTQWRELMDRMKRARYGAIFFEPSSESEGLLSLVQEMNAYTRCVALPLGAATNSAGAGQVLTWQTGQPSAISFANGFPQSDVAEYSAAALLTNHKADAALIVACDPLANPIASLPEAARGHLARIPLIVLHTADCEPAYEPAVSITVATPGIQTAGTVFRSDGVALPLRPAIESQLPSAEEVLRSINDQV